MHDDLKAAVGWGLAENVLDGVMLTAPDGRIFAANPTACALLARSEEEIVALGRAGLIVPDQELDRALEERRRTGATTRDLRMIRGDGSILVAEATSRVFEGPHGGPLTVVTLRDVTERRRLERELAESEQRFRALSDASAEAVAVHVDGVLVDANRPFFELFRYPAGLPGALRVSELVAPGSRPDAEVFVAAQGEGPIELELLRCDGTTFYGEVRARNVMRDGVAARVASIIDVDERRRAEAERAESAARAAELDRFRSLTALAGGIAHEFNNTLQAILAATELARDPASTRDDVSRLLGQIGEALQRAIALASAMLAYSGHQSVRRRRVDLAELAAAAIAAFGRRADFDAAVEVEGLEQAFVLVDEEAIAGVVAVLLENAADASPPPERRIGVRVGVAVLSAEEAAGAFPAAEVEPGEHAFLEVSDRGEGMDESTRARMFDPFFSTRFPGRGLGLSAALGVARAHGGGFVVRSQPGRGTSVRLLVPLDAGGAAAGPG